MYAYTAHKNNARREEEGIRNPVTRDGVLVLLFFFFTKYLINLLSIHLFNPPTSQCYY